MTLTTSHDVDDDDDDCGVPLCVWGGKPNANIVEVGTTTSLASTGHTHDDDEETWAKIGQH